MQPYYDEGGVTIYCCDCRELDIANLGDVLVIDPPYGQGYSSNHGGAFQGASIANDHSLAVRDEVLDAWGDAPAAVFGKWNVPKWGNPRGVLVWDKGPASGKAPAGVVVDTFMGCGSTLRAAKDLGRRAVGVELEERYCEAAVASLAQGALPFARVESQ